MLRLDHINRSFGDLRALDDVSFGVAPGRLTGFIGANGAGKTTTMRIILGVLAADSGSVTLDGAPLSPTQRQTIGYMPEERGLYPKMKVIDQLVHLARLHGYDRAAARRSASALIESLGLAERADEPLEKLSLGNQQRVQIVAAVMARPTALVLDEPFSGLDPTAVDEMADVLREHARRGAPILFSSHQLDLVERLCDRLVVLARGRVVAAGTAQELRAHAAVRHRLVLSGDAGWTRDHPGVHVADVEGRTALVEILESGADRALLSEALRRGDVHEFARLVPPLSEIYREVTADHLAGVA